MLTNAAAAAVRSSVCAASPPPPSQEIAVHYTDTDVERARVDTFRVDGLVVVLSAACDA